MKGAKEINLINSLSTKFAILLRNALIIKRYFW